MKLLEKLGQMFPRQSQDKVMAYVGRALSFDLPQLYKNIRDSIRYGIKYGMRTDPIVTMIERDNIDWDQVQKDYEADVLERKAKRPISEIDSEATMDAVMSTPSGEFEAARDANLKKILGEDGPRYVETLKATAKPEELYPLPDFKRAYEGLLDSFLCGTSPNNYINMIGSDRHRPIVNFDSGHATLPPA